MARKLDGYYASVEGVSGNTVVERYSDFSEMQEAIEEHKTTGYQACRISKRVFEKEVKSGNEAPRETEED